MNKKKIKEELQSRRGFFKKAAKSALPIIAGVSLSSCEAFMSSLSYHLANSSVGGASYSSSSNNGGGSENGCGYTCSGGCSGGCDGTCQWGCETTCKGGCSGSSVVIHYGD